MRLTAIGSARFFLTLVFYWGLQVPAAHAVTSPTGSNLLSPTALVGVRDGSTLLIACTKPARLLEFDIATSRVTASMPVPGSVPGFAPSTDGARLLFTCAAPESQVCVADIASHRVIAAIRAGHTATAPVLSPDGKRVYVCSRFDNDVSVIDLAAKRELCRISVQREPVAADITKDGWFLLVANHLPNGRADTAYVAAAVSVIDTGRGQVVKELHLPNGSGSLKDLRISPDGKYAALTHLVAQFKKPTVRPVMNWISANALTIIDAVRLEVVGSVLLDDRGKGAANPWGLAWSADGSTLVVAHAGTHEVSIIDFPAFLKRLLNLPAPFDPFASTNSVTVSQQEIDLLNYLPYFPGPRRRVKLPPTDLGPRAVAIIGHTAYVANYFSDTLTLIDLADPESKPHSIPMSDSALRTPHSTLDSTALPRSALPTPHSALDLVRQGEFYFHDATICFQGWQSCSSCHPGDGRSDGLNWDLLNDGIGNPKNTKSLLLAFQTPPAMSLGVRETAETAVRAGIEHILFTKQPPQVSNAYTRVVFRVGDDDARKLAEGLSFFEARDLQNLETGQAVVRVERSDFDFNVSVLLAADPDQHEARTRRKNVITASRNKYGLPRADVEAALRQGWESERPPEKPTSKPVVLEKKPSSALEPPLMVDKPAPPLPPKAAPSERKAPESPADLGRGGAQHKAIQQRIKQVAEGLGFRSMIEKAVLEGQGSVDLLLERQDQSIACEVSITTTIDHEVGNIQKCLKAGFPKVAVIGLDEGHLQKIAKAVAQSLGPEAAAPVEYFLPDQFIAHLGAMPSLEAKAEARPEKRRGYTIKRSTPQLSPEEQKQREEAAIRSIAEAMRRKGK